MEIQVSRWKPGAGHVFIGRYSPKGLYVAFRSGIVDEDVGCEMLIEDGRSDQTWQRVREINIRRLLPFVIKVSRAGSVIGTYGPNELAQAYEKGMVTDFDHMLVDDGFDGVNWEQVTSGKVHSAVWREALRLNGLKQPKIVNPDGSPYRYQLPGMVIGLPKPPPKQRGWFD